MEWMPAYIAVPNLLSMISMGGVHTEHKRDFWSCQRNSSGLERSHLGLKLNKNKFEWLPTNYMDAAKLPTLTFSSHRA
jgi:hypothetical protein